MKSQPARAVGIEICRSGSGAYPSLSHSPRGLWGLKLQYRPATEGGGLRCSSRGLWESSKAWGMYCRVVDHVGHVYLKLSMVFRSKCPIYSTHRSKIGDKIAADEVKCLFYPLIEYWCTERIGGFADVSRAYQI